MLPVFLVHMPKKQATLGDVNDTLRNVYFNLRFCLKESFVILLMQEWGFPNSHVVIYYVSDRFHVIVPGMELSKRNRLKSKAGSPL